MTYRVDLTDRAAADLAGIYLTINGGHARRAHALFNGLEKAIQGLEDYPARGTVTPEDGSLRQVLYGSRRNRYRVIYAIDERERVVRVLHIRHGVRHEFASGEPIVDE